MIFHRFLTDAADQYDSHTTLSDLDLNFSAKCELGIGMLCYGYIRFDIYSSYVSDKCRKQGLKFILYVFSD